MAKKLTKEDYQRKYGKSIDKLLYELYWGQNLAIRKVAKALNMGKNVIPKLLHIFNIKVRTHSEAQMGERNHRYGSRLTEEEKQHLREKLSGEGNPRYGVILTQQERDNIGRGRKGKGQWTEERKKKHREMISGENHPFYKCKLPEEHRKKIGQTRIARGVAKGEKNPFYRKQHTEKSLRKIMQSNNTSPNRKELELQSIFNKYKLPYKFVGDAKVVIDGKIPDFINTNHEKKIIELYGDYWHADEKLENGGDNGESRKRTFAKYGYNTLIVWEHELRDGEVLLNRIREFDCDDGTFVPDYEKKVFKIGEKE